MFSENYLSVCIYCTRRRRSSLPSSSSEGKFRSGDVIRLFYEENYSQSQRRESLHSWMERQSRLIKWKSRYSECEPIETWNVKRVKHKFISDINIFYNTEVRLENNLKIIHLFVHQWHKLARLFKCHRSFKDPTFRRSPRFNISVLQNKTLQHCVR